MSAVFKFYNRYLNTEFLKLSDNTNKFAAFFFAEKRNWPYCKFDYSMRFVHFLKTFRK